MPVRLRLRRTGTKNKPAYRVVACDKRSPRDGKFIEILGYYDPRREAERVDLERCEYWLSVGAQPSRTVEDIITRAREGRSMTPAPKSPVEDTPAEAAPAEEEAKAEEAKAEEAKAEEAKAEETKDEAPAKEEAKAEEAKAEETKDEAPAKEEAKEEAKEDAKADEAKDKKKAE